MRRLIITSVMAMALFYVCLVDLSYAENLANDLAELTGTEITEENVPMILAQEKSTVGNEEWQEPYDTKKVEKEDEDDEESEEEVEEDDPDAGVRQEKRNRIRTEKVKKH